MDLELLKTNCEDEFHLWFNEISTLSDDLSASHIFALKKIHIMLYEVCCS